MRIHLTVKPGRIATFCLTGLCVLGLAACGSSDKDKTPLPGKRISVLELQKNLEPDSAALEAQGFVAPEAWANEFWPQKGGYPGHAMQRLALADGRLHKLWDADIGDGAQPHIPLITSPVVADGRIFTIDTNSTMRAFDIKTGKRLWSIDITPKGSDHDPVIAGGISFSQGRLYVTSGFNDLLVVDPASGKIIWRKPLPTPSRAAPTVQDNRLFVQTLDNQILAFDIETGNLLWQYAGVAATAGLVGAPSPAAGRDVVIPALSSGEIYALRSENGAVLWSDNLNTTRRLGNLASLGDIRGLPVLDKGVVFAISFGGKMVAIDVRTGTRIWQREIGGTETPWVAGNYVFVISSNNELVGMGRDNGTILWVTPLPGGNKKGSDQAYWAGPIMGGNRLIAASSKGLIADIDPATGKILDTWNASGPVTIEPIIANGVLYVLSDDGTLSAYK